MAENVVKVCDEENVDISTSNKQVICSFCHRGFSKYKCPRCNDSFCSTTCYKSEKHIKCSEDFYRENVVEELANRAKDPKDVQNVLKMLKTLEEQNIEHEESDGPSIEERFSDINLNTADVDVIWKALTYDEQKEFEECVRAGDLSDLIVEWVPWWHQNDQRSNGIEEITPADTKEQSFQKQSSDQQKQSCPKILKKIPLLTCTANPLIKYSIIDILYSYVYIMRLYNGEPEENLHQYIAAFYELASSLSKSLSFDSIGIVVHNALNAVQDNKHLWNSQEFSHNALLDVCEVLSGRHVIDGEHVDFIDCVLSDICRLFTKTKKAIKCEEGSSKEHEKKMLLAKKKVKFFLSWVQSNKQVLYSMIPELRAAHLELTSNSKIHDKERREMDTSRRKLLNKKKLIQEL